MLPAVLPAVLQAGPVIQRLLARHHNINNSLVPSAENLAMAVEDAKYPALLPSRNSWLSWCTLAPAYYEDGKVHRSETEWRSFVETNILFLISMCDSVAEGRARMVPGLRNETKVPTGPWSSPSDASECLYDCRRTATVEYLVDSAAQSRFDHDLLALTSGAWHDPATWGDTLSHLGPTFTVQG